MCEYYFDDERAVAYKIYPIVTSTIKDDNTGADKAILVHTNIKATNFKKEKARRPVSELFPVEQYNEDKARKTFHEKTLVRVLGKARKISEQEYDSIKSRVEVKTI